MKKKANIKPPLLLETIKIDNGEIQNLEYHNRRFNSSRRVKFGAISSATSSDTGSEATSPLIDDIDLGSIISVPREMSEGIVRCRVLYQREIEKIEFVPHVDRIVRSLKLVYSDTIDYALKYAAREPLMSLFELRGNCDEILIVKDGFISDTSISNIVFRRKDGSWVTPDTPLLNGTMRMFLLDRDRISEANIRPDDLKNFSGARLINCMTGLETGHLIPMDQIF